MLDFIIHLKYKSLDSVLYSEEIFFFFAAHSNNYNKIQLG